MSQTLRRMTDILKMRRIHVQIKIGSHAQLNGREKLTDETKKQESIGGEEEWVVKCPPSNSSPDDIWIGRTLSSKLDTVQVG